MWSAIISGIAAIASAIISGVARKRQGDRARNEARSLSAIQRKDERMAAGRANEIARGDINLRGRQLASDKEMFNKTSNLQRTQEQYQTNVANRSKLTNSVQSLFQPKDESWLYKGRVLGRFA